MPEAMKAEFAMSNTNKDAEALGGLLFILFLVGVAVVAMAILLAVGAILIIGWYVTYLLIRLLDDIYEGQLVAEHSGVVLLLSSGLWAGIAWLLISPQWLYVLADIWPNIIDYQVVIPLTGAALGLTWALLVVFFMETQTTNDLLDSSGMYQFSEHDLYNEEPSALDLLTDAVLLGTDEDG